MSSPRGSHLDLISTLSGPVSLTSGFSPQVPSPQAWTFPCPARSYSCPCPCSSAPCPGAPSAPPAEQRSRRKVFILYLKANSARILGEVEGALERVPERVFLYMKKEGKKLRTNLGNALSLGKLAVLALACMDVMMGLVQPVGLNEQNSCECVLIITQPSGQSCQNSRGELKLLKQQPLNSWAGEEEKVYHHSFSCCHRDYQTMWERTKDSCPFGLSGGKEAGGQ